MKASPKHKNELKTGCSLERAATEALKSMTKLELDQRLEGLERGRFLKLASHENLSEVDFNTGEVKREITRHKTVVKTQPPYFKVYIDDASRFYLLNSGQKNLVFELARSMNMRGEIILNKRLRADISTRTGLDSKSLANYITDLIKMGILHRVGSNEYFLDPELIGRGEWKHVDLQREYWRCVVKYNKEGKPLNHQNDQNGTCTHEK